MHTEHLETLSSMSFDMPGQVDVFHYTGFISDVPQVLHLDRNGFPGLGPSCHDEIFNFSQSWILLRRLTNLKQFTRTDWDIEHKTEQFGSIHLQAQHYFHLVCMHGIAYQQDTCTFLARSVRLGRMAVDATLAIVVLAVLCIVVSSECSLAVYGRSVRSRLVFHTHTDGICLWQSKLPTSPFQSVRSFVQPMSSLEKQTQQVFPSALGMLLGLTAKHLLEW